jgi:hypothetical protein
MARRGEGGEIGGRGFAGEKLCHDARGCRGEENAVAVVAGGNVMIRSTGDSAEEWETVGSGGTKASPAFKDRRRCELRQKAGRLGVEVGDIGGMDDLVEADVFNCCADDGASGVGAAGSRDYIDGFGADGKTEGK